MVWLLVFLFLLSGCGPTFTNRYAKERQANEDFFAGRITAEECRAIFAQAEKDAHKAQDDYVGKVAPGIAILGMFFGKVPGHGRVTTKTVPSGNGSYTTTYTVWP